MLSAYYTPLDTLVKVKQENEAMSLVQFPSGKTIWVKSSMLDFDYVGPEWVEMA